MSSQGAGEAGYMPLLPLKQKVQFKNIHTCLAKDPELRPFRCARNELKNLLARNIPRVSHATGLNFRVPDADVRIKSAPRSRDSIGRNRLGGG